MSKPSVHNAPKEATEQEEEEEEEVCLQLDEAKRLPVCM